MYVYELARDLGAEPRELIEHAALVGLGHLVPNSALSPEEATAVRDAYIKAASPSRGSLFSGGAPAASPPPGPPAAPPSSEPPPAPPPAAWDDPAPSTGAGGAGGGAFDGIDAPLSGAGLGEPLGFAPPGGAAPSYAPPPPSTPPPEAPRWDDPQPWDPLPGGITLGGGPIGYDDPPAARPTVDYSAPVPDREYQPHFPVEDRKPLPSGSSASRTVLIGVVGLAVVVLVSMFAARQMGIIGPGAERTCLLYTDPDPDGEGMIEELVCVDGYGKEVRREIRTPGAGVRGLEFGTTEAGDTARVVDLAGFCRGADDFLGFRTGLTEQIGSTSSVGVMGRWYEDNDGFGEGGVETMISSFGNAGPNQRVVDLRSYLATVRDAGRSPDLAQAQMLLAAAEAEHGEAATSVRNFANNNC